MHKDIGTKMYVLVFSVTVKKKKKWKQSELLPREWLNIDITVLWSIMQPQKSKNVFLHSEIISYSHWTLNSERSGTTTCFLGPNTACHALCFQLSHY